jgi:hypothetical protein
MTIPQTLGHKDLASSVWRTALIWGPGLLAISLTGPYGGWMRTIGWILGMLWLAAFCLWNAARCRRVHCLFTGPLFLLLAVAGLLTGLGVVSLGPNTWNILNGVFLVGAVVLCCLPELVWGRYWRRSEGQSHSSR